MNLYQSHLSASFGAARHEADTDSRDVFTTIKPVIPSHSCYAPLASPQHRQPERREEMLQVNPFLSVYTTRFTGLELGDRWHLKTSPYFARWLVDLLIFFIRPGCRKATKDPNNPDQYSANQRCRKRRPESTL
ncbi:uncharacterized protein BHQ10_006778 [Talaromyces amestolkiae]|uniref:Uncharacterized protein n=1 Tax=Talaromyces amestolkiae TaxID=1196081 RepID=A0A364L4N9_TALAM|nr:uncharacterized protein BHQ10_006778 [Talaromyces amestolkiae]RAO70766.1 hypothetical protein BHQ10_006778 [Talaromyces amestolkiae]